MVVVQHTAFVNALLDLLGMLPYLLLIFFYPKGLPPNG
jgi:hypothetical protein